MKTVLLLILAMASLGVNAQSLKDLLYSGKLKNDTGVVRKTDDLNSKIDTSTKKPVDSANVKVIDMASPDSSVFRNPTQLSNIYATQAADPSTGIASTTPRPAPKNNDEAWGYYMDDIMSDIQNDINAEKKVKSGSYQVFINYDIDTDGSVRVRNVIVAPESEALQKLVRDRVNQTAPTLKPVLASNGQPRKGLGKYNFTITKK